MKYFVFFLISFSLISCEQEEGCFDEKLNQDEARVDCGGSCNPCALEYPAFGMAGTNILAGEDTLFTSESEISLAVLTPRGSSLNVELRLISGTPWSTSDNSGWTVNEYIFDRQLFFAPVEELADVTLTKGSPLTSDTILLRYFENGANQTLRKVVVWE